jgi:ABC-2 type transport system ATP-binding protein
VNPTTNQTFPYTARQGDYLSTIGAMLFLALLEGGLLTLLVVALVENGLLRLGLLGVLALVNLWVAAKFLAPLGTAHQLSSTHLHLRYGLDLQCDLPRSALLAAWPVHEKRNPLEAATVQYQAEQQRVTATFSEQGQVLLALARPYPVRVGQRGGGLTSQILINVDDREGFLAAFDLPSTPPAVKDPVMAQDELTAASSLPRPAVLTLPAARRAGGAAIRTENLARRYGDFVAVGGLHLNVQAGEIYGFLGSNGAGKTTTIKMLVGLLAPSHGRAWVDGHDVWQAPLAAKAALGYVPDRALLYERLTGREYLAFLAQMRGIPYQEAIGRMETLLEALGLAEQAERPSGSYSFGMQRKLALAGALLHQPRVLILDEPLNGLDPRSARHLKELFRELVAGGSTILLSTHDLATAEEICQRVGVIHHGRLVAEGSAAELRVLVGAPDLEAVFLNLTAKPLEVAA